MSIAIAAQWCTNLVVSGSFPVLFGDSSLNAFAHGGVPFWIYGGFALLAVFLVLRYVPETKGIDSEPHRELSGAGRPGLPATRQPERGSPTMKLAKVSTSHIQAVTGTTFVATLSSLLFGYATAVIAGVVGAIDHNFI